MDSWCYLAYDGGKELLKEMMQVSSDNPEVKNYVIQKIETEGSADFDIANFPDTKSGTGNAFKVFMTVSGLKV